MKKVLILSYVDLLALTLNKIKSEKNVNKSFYKIFVK